MKYMIFGALGAAAVLALLALGALIGWKACVRQRRATAETPAEEELRRLKEEQEAFLRLQNYNADVAYGIAGGAARELEGSDGR